MLNFDIDERELQRIAEDLGASERQVHKAFNRALGRTAGTLRKMAAKGLRSELELRSISALRSRLRTIRLKKRGLSAARLWFGTNDLPVSAFKGRPTKGKAGRGASFRGREYPGAFVAKGKSGKQSIWKRVGAGRLPVVEETVPVADQMESYLEDEVFDELEKIFFHHFRSDLRARTAFGVGR